MSTQTPRLDRRRARAVAEVERDQVQRGERPAERLGGPLRHVAVRGAVEAVAAHAEAPVPRVGHARSGRRAAGSVWWKAVSKTATCGTPGKAVEADLDPDQVGRVVERRERAPARGSRRARSASIRAGAWKRSPPCTTRWPMAVSRPASSAPLLRSAAPIFDEGLAMALCADLLEPAGEALGLVHREELVLHGGAAAVDHEHRAGHAACDRSGRWCTPR